MAALRKKNIANYRAIPQDRYARHFLDYAIESLSCVFRYRKNFIFYRSILTGLASDPVFRISFEDYRTEFINSNRIVDTQILNSSSDIYIYDSQSLFILSEFIHFCVEKTASAHWYTKQYVICRALISGLSSDCLFSGNFESLKKGYMRDVVSKDGSDYGAISFITEILGSF